MQELTTMSAGMLASLKRVLETMKANLASLPIEVTREIALLEALLDSGSFTPVARRLKWHARGLGLLHSPSPPGACRPPLMKVT